MERNNFFFMNVAFSILVLGILAGVGSAAVTLSTLGPAAKYAYVTLMLALIAILILALLLLFSRLEMHGVMGLARGQEARLETLAKPSMLWNQLKLVSMYVDSFSNAQPMVKAFVPPLVEQGAKLIAQGNTLRLALLAEEYEKADCDAFVGEALAYSERLVKRLEELHLLDANGMFNSVGVLLQKTFAENPTRFLRLSDDDQRKSLMVHARAMANWKESPLTPEGLVEQAQQILRQVKALHGGKKK